MESLDVPTNLAEEITSMPAKIHIPYESPLSVFSAGKRKIDSAKVIQNLIKILGFPPNELSSILRSAKPIVLVKKLNQVNHRMRRKEQKLCQNLQI